MIMKCKNCKYRKNIGNTSETGSAICSYSSSWFPVNIENNCHLIPEKRNLRVVIVLDWVKIRHVLTALKMTVQYIMDNCAEGLWMNGKKNLNNTYVLESSRILWPWKNACGILLVLRMVVKNFALYFVMLMILHMVDLRK